MGRPRGAREWVGASGHWEEQHREPGIAAGREGSAKQLLERVERTAINIKNAG